MKLDRVEAILQLLHRQHHVGALTVEGDGWRIEARRGLAAPQLPAHPPALAAEPPEPVRHPVIADRVGVFRSTAALPRRGEKVERGRKLGSIDSMRILNPLAASAEGYLCDIRVEDGEPVEYGQVLFVLGEQAPSPDDLQ